MIRATSILPPGHWHQDAADSIVLDHVDRHRRRLAMTGVRGVTFLLDLADAVALRHGDGLLLDDGRLIEVVAAPEELSEIRGRDAHHVVRLAWHLGNRHLPVEINGTKLRIRRDGVVEDMLRGLGAKVVHIEGPFEPETGAYARPHAEHEHAKPEHAHHDHDHHKHGHDHSHDHHDHAGHDHSHAHDDHHHAPVHVDAHPHLKALDPAAAQGHVHDEHCGHDHAHDHQAHHKHGHGHTHD